MCLQIPLPLKSRLNRNDVTTLDHLCAMHNLLQDQLVAAEKERQEVLTDATLYEIGVFQAIQQLEDIRIHVTECLRIALAKPRSTEDLPKREPDYLSYPPLERIVVLILL